MTLVRWLPSSRVCSGCRHSSASAVRASCAALCWRRQAAASAWQQGTSTRCCAFFLQGKGDGVIGGGVASVQGGDDVKGSWQGAAGAGLLHRQGQKLHPRKTQPLRQCAGFFNQFWPCFYAIDSAAIVLLEKQVVEDKAQIRLARAVVGQRDVAAPIGLQLRKQRFDKAKQVVNLLELAARVLVDCAIAGEDVQLFEQIQRLPRA